MLYGYLWVLTRLLTRLLCCVDMIEWNISYFCVRDKFVERG
ncbi:hypothetical protein HMPREF3208_00270 [Gardnerella vaginalis]|uniref:Uncharacterized protein n=1 Tax=Gardnerella vaginalis TaxID=2702 RepID=A0A133P1Y0_GARVA|nr:hypothetical protein HMPREF3208_00270 [Gardnerella vaginalis]